MADLKGTILLLLLIPVATVICLPILLGSMLVAFLLALPFEWLGQDVAGYFVLVLGFGGGLVLCFLALVFLYRRVPARFRWIFDEDPPRSRHPGGPPPAFGRDPRSDPSTLEQRVRELDASLSEGGDGTSGIDGREQP
jgi:hypothetical protein